MTDKNRNPEDDEDWSDFLNPDAQHSDGDEDLSDLAFEDTWVPDGPGEPTGTTGEDSVVDASEFEATWVTDGTEASAEQVSKNFVDDTAFEDTWVPDDVTAPPQPQNEGAFELAGQPSDSGSAPDPEAPFRETVSLFGPPQPPSLSSPPSPQDLPQFAEAISIFDDPVDEVTIDGADGDSEGRATVIGDAPIVDPNATMVGEAIAEPEPVDANSTVVGAQPIDPNATVVGGGVTGRGTVNPNVTTNSPSGDFTADFAKGESRTRPDVTQNAGAHIPLPRIERSVEERLNVKHRPVSGSPFGDKQQADFEVLAQIGAGAMGVVYSAEQTSLNRNITFKTLKSWWDTVAAPLKNKLDPEQYFQICQQLRSKGSLSPEITRELKTRIGDEEVERLSVQLRTMGNSMASQHPQTEQWKRDLFLSEAIVTGNLVHPNIIPIHDVGAMEDGTLFYSMKWVHGTPWNEQMHSMSLRDNLKILLSMCDAIAFAHHKGIINRDLKPENVMLGEFGEVLVLDWGLAIATPAFEKKNDITTQARPGSGTPVYMAPELLNGPMEKIGTWSDVYLLAAILFEIATGNPPHDFSSSVGMTPAERKMRIFKVVGENIVRDPGTSGELIDIAMKSLQTEPDLRHDSVNEFKQAILDFLKHAESLRLSHRADELVDGAGERVAERGYDDYQTATALYEEALREWPGNEQAATGLDGTLKKYAQVAYKKGDYDLGIHILSNQTDGESVRQTIKLKRARRNRAGMKWAIIGSLATILIGGSAATWRIDQDRQAKQRLIGDVQVAEQKVATADETARTKIKVAQTEADKKIRVATLEAADKVSAAETEAEQKISVANRTAAEKVKDAELESKRRIDMANQEVAKANVKVEESETKARQIQQSLASAKQQLMEVEQQKQVAERQRQFAEFRGFKAQADGYIRAGEYSNAVPILRGLIENQENEFSKRNRLQIRRTLERALQNSVSTQLPVETGSVSRDGRTMVIGQNNRAGGSARVLIRNVNVGNQSKPNNDDDKAAIELQTELTSVVLAPDNRTVVVASGSQVMTWILPDRQSKRALATCNSNVTAMAFSASGEHLFVGTSGGNVKAVRLKDGRISGTTRYDSAVRDIAMFPDGSVMLAALGRGQQSICVANRVKSTNSSVRFTRMGQLSLPVADRVPLRRLSISADAEWLAASNTQNGDIFVFPRRKDGKRDEFPFVGGAELSHRGWKLSGHTRKVNSMDFSADGTQLVTASDDYTLGVWQLAGSSNNARGSRFRFHRTHTLMGHGGAVEACSFLPQQGRVLSMSRDHFVRIWDLKQYETQRQQLLKETEAQIETKSAMRSTTKPSGDNFDVQPFVLTAFNSSTRAIQKEKSPADRNNRQEIVIKGHEAGVLSARFNRDGRRVLTASRDRTARAWDTETANQISTTAADKTSAIQTNVFDEGHIYNVSALKFFPGGKRLLTSAYGSMSLWDVQPGIPGTGYELARLDGIGIYSAADVSADETLILTSARGNTARLWKTTDVLSSDRPRPTVTLKGSHKYPVTAVAISPAGQLAATGDRRGKLVIWNCGTGQSLSVENGAHGGDQVSEVRFVSESRLLTSGFDGQIILWKVSDNGECDVVHKFKKTGGFVTVLEMSPDAKQFVATIRNRKGKAWATELRLWQIDRQNPVRSFDVKRIHRSTARTSDQSGATDKDEFGKSPNEVDVHSLSWSADGSRLAVATDNVLTTMNTKSWRIVSRVTERSGRMSSALVAYRPGSASTPQHLATSNGVATHLWDLASGKHIVSFRAHAAVFSSAWSADERYVVTASRSLRIFNARDKKNTGQSLFKIERPHHGPVSHVEFSPGNDGRRFVSVGLDGSGRIWDWDAETKSIRRLRSLETEDDHPHINFATWLPGGNSVLTVSDDGQPRLWSLEESTQPVRLPVELTDGPWNCLCGGVSPDGKWIAVGGVQSSSEESIGFVWNIEDRQSPRRHCRIEGHGQGGITSLCFSADSNYLVTGGSDGAVYQWDWIPDGLNSNFTALNVFTFARAGKNEAHQASVTAIDTATDGRIVTASEDGTVVIWRQFQNQALLRGPSRVSDRGWRP